MATELPDFHSKISNLITLELRLKGYKEENKINIATVLCGLFVRFCNFANIPADAVFSGVTRAEAVHSSRAKKPLEILEELIHKREAKSGSSNVIPFVKKDNDK